MLEIIDITQTQTIRTGARIVAYVDTIVQHCYKPKLGNMCETSTPQKWSQLPPPGDVLVGVDAALFDDCSRMG
jgi:hypothetical protein